MSEYFRVCGWSNVCWNCFHVQEPFKATCELCNSKLIEIYHYLCDYCTCGIGTKCVSKLELKQCVLCNYIQLETNETCSKCTTPMSQNID